MSRDAFKLDVVSIRLVRDAPIYSDQKLNSPQAAVHLVGEVLCDMDRELVCVINLKADGTPINCSFVSAGRLMCCGVSSGIYRSADRKVPHLKGNGFHPDL